jgi:hypothetical protein
MCEDLCSAHREYVAVEIRVWKWRFEFELYDTEQRIVERSKAFENYDRR